MGPSRQPRDGVADCQPQGPGMGAAMARKRRKTLVVCRDCHTSIHASGLRSAKITGELTAMKAALGSGRVLLEKDPTHGRAPRQRPYPD